MRTPCRCVDTGEREEFELGVVVDYTVCPKKRTTYFQIVVTQLRIVDITKVGRVLERAEADLSNAYNKTQIFWHLVNFKLQYLGSRLSDRKVIICV